MNVRIEGKGLTNTMGFLVVKSTFCPAMSVTFFNSLSDDVNAIMTKSIGKKNTSSYRFANVDITKSINDDDNQLSSSTSLMLRQRFNIKFESILRLLPSVESGED